MDKYEKQFYEIANTFKKILDDATNSETGYLMMLVPISDLNNLDIMSSLSKKQIIEVLQNAIIQVEHSKNIT